MMDSILGNGAIKDIFTIPSSETRKELDQLAWVGGDSGRRLHVEEEPRPGQGGPRPALSSSAWSIQSLRRPGEQLAELGQAGQYQREELETALKDQYGPTVVDTVETGIQRPLQHHRLQPLLWTYFLLAMDSCFVTTSRLRSITGLSPLPNIDLKVNDIGAHPVLDNEKLAAWQSQNVKDYKVWVLDKSNTKAYQKAFAPELGHPVETIAELYNRPLRFNTDFRPRSRYMWWAFLNSIQQFTARQPHNQSGVHQEVLDSKRYWGTQDLFWWQDWGQQCVQCNAAPHVSLRIIRRAGSQPSDPFAVSSVDHAGFQQPSILRGKRSHLGS
ncbi:hypothetical protein G6O67_000674 [Ophiocordyceps sinensis]|uniref:Uncharacterized protein n=2 Tax=Ophiocordyceps sinensis TaxID=72228 RepID=A0A8H4PZH1_9HYPO|nr:hypothetical protein OCS_01267 [Ophiocordyceps sinensis CO18]KAF4513399.1 hypothetical protein G6O67_000674 [Ophiocordyceps sinensis]